MMNKKMNFIGYIIILMMMSIFFTGCQTKAYDNKEKEVAVEVATVEKKDISKNITLNSILEPEENAVILPKTPGVNVTDIRVNIGDKVSKGDFLFELDKTMVRKQIETAKEAYDLARKNYEEQSILAVATNQVDQTRMAYSLALSQLKEMEYYAPIDGYISQMNININQPVITAVPSIIITNMDKLKASIHIPKYLYESLKKGQSVVVHVDNNEVIGKIKNLSPVPDLTNNLYTVEVGIENKENQPWIGEFSSILIEFNQKEESIVIPKSAVLEDEVGKYVFVENNKRVYRRNIEVGIDNNNEIEIINGLNEGEQIVIKGQQFVKDKGLVMVVRGDDNEDL